ncbi:hypothetical protein X777_10902 [Ooceraea biroi]|uniref:Tyr recombinase domain-containing protein n=1 Tax=Ooceraea biroi TaxID=2015173 RepID=A0A026W4N0_OOCBI|nr:hypothetical protein X777_10902 [Ooceraea biroi]
MTVYIEEGQVPNRKQCFHPHANLADDKRLLQLHTCDLRNINSQTGSLLFTGDEEIQRPGHILVLHHSSLVPINTDAPLTQEIDLQAGSHNAPDESVHRRATRAHTIPNELEPNSPEKAPRATITTISPHDNVVSSQTPTSLTHIPGDNSHLAETQTGNISKSLDPEVLEAIDKRLDDNTSKGPPIHDDIFVRWNDIFKEGLPKEEITDLFKKYAIPENCGLVAVCLAALGSLLTKLAEKEDIDRVSLITTLSDTTRLLIDLQRDETLTRRLIILSNLNPSLKATLNATTADEFGRDTKNGKVFGKVCQRPQTPGEEAPAVISQDAKKPECSSSSNTVSPDGDEEAIEVFHPRSQVILPPEENFESTNEFILQETSLNHSVNTLSGRLKHFIPVWKELFSDKVVEWLEGYIIPFTDPLIQLREPAEPNWSKNERMLLADHIRQLLFKVALILGPEIGSNPDIKRFCKGASNLRPALPRYNVTWDPKIVLDSISKWFPNEEIPLQHLSGKLATLLALTTGQRLQTLIAIDIRNIEKTEEHIAIKIPAHLKTSGHQRLQPNLILPFYPEDPTICVARALEIYLDRTRHLRNETTSPFIS